MFGCISKQQQKHKHIETYNKKKKESKDSVRAWV